MKTRQRILDAKFEGNERRLEAFVRNDEGCRRAILQAAGLDSPAVEVVEFRPHFYGIPDVPCRLRDGRVVIIELAFALDARHGFKDLAYVADPAAANVAGLVWLCDSVSTRALEMVRYYAARFALRRQVTLEILIPQDGRFDAPPPLRYAFDAQIRDLRAGTSYPSSDGVTVLERLTQMYRVADEIDTVALARVLGVSQTWVTLHALRPRAGGHEPRLECKKSSDGTRLRGPNERLLFDLDRVWTFVEAFEHHVTRLEIGNSNVLLPLVSARDPRIGNHWLTLEAFRRETPTRQYRAIKRRLGVPAAFCVSSSGRGYSPLWPRERGSALPPLVANDNRPLAMLTRGAAL